jgi:hypothetical protein
MRSVIPGVILACTLALATQAQAQNLLVNGSFEQPGTVKIRGWNGETGADIPGWASDTQAVDSGVESDWPGHTDGLWSGFLMSDNGSGTVDPSVWQLSSHSIQATDLLLLQVDARNNWSAAGYADLFVSIYYDNLGVRTLANSATFRLNDVWTEYQVLFDAASMCDAWCKLVGVELRNVTDPATGGSWVGIDNVRLSIPEPGAFALLGFGLLALALRRRSS